MKIFKPITRLYESTKNFFTIVNYPIGVDEEFDEECDNAFHTFLDYLYYTLVTCFSIFAAVSAYFFVSYAL